MSHPHNQHHPPAAPGKEHAKHVREDLQTVTAHSQTVMEHVEHGGGHAGRSEAMFARPFWISLVLTLPILVYADLFQELFGYQAPQFPGSARLPPVRGTGVLHAQHVRVVWAHPHDVQVADFGQLARDSGGGCGGTWSCHDSCSRMTPHLLASCSH